ncbi:hypothetical protein GGX14DRAFT_649470 [Mycena pura]|uniref:DUF6534 domain-containing protein n=1 Tax=Mycena pura TaxID=153505 RepID=A0AAD6YN16_9AGAR|nr:hypothetical protein GGX14DRAFT_649470 [Mycena pura]
MSRFTYFIWDLGWATLATFYDSDSNNMGVETTLDRTWGLVYIAVVLSAALYGAGILQFWLYIRRYHARDPLTVQFVVIAVILCDTVQQALLCHAVYEYLVYAVKAVQLKAFADIITLQKLGIAVNSLSAACDIVISIVLILLLKLSKTGFKKSTDLINKLIVFTFNTGLPTSLCALLTAIFVAASPSTFLYIFFYLLLGRLYTNSLLVTLNSRDYIKSTSQPASGEQYSLEHTVRNATRMPPRDQITIRIDKDTMHDFPLSSGDDLKSGP